MHTRSLRSFRSALALALLASPLVLGSACNNAVSKSLPVTINVDAKGEDKKTSVDVDKGITTESGNPYSAFITEGRKALGGKDPSRIEVDSASLLLGAKSTNVTKFEDVFSGRVDVLFVMNDSNNTYPVAHADSVAGQGPVAFKIDWDSSKVVAGTVDRDKLLGGGFKVVVRGPAATAFQVKGPVANLQITFQFTALE